MFQFFLWLVGWVWLDAIISDLSDTFFLASSAPGFRLGVVAYRSSQFENSLRRHNHLGLLHALLLVLAKAGKLEGAKEGARGVMRERREQARERREKGLGVGGMEED